MDTAIELYNAFGKTAAIAIALIFAIIKGFPLILENISKWQDNKKKNLEIRKQNLNKTEKSLKELTKLVVEDEKWKCDVSKKLDELNHKMDNNKLEAIRRHILDFEQDIKNGEKKSEHQWEYLWNERKTYKECGGNGYIDRSVKFLEKEYDKVNQL